MQALLLLLCEVLTARTPAANVLVMNRLHSTKKTDQVKRSLVSPKDTVIIRSCSEVDCTTFLDNEADSGI